MAGLLVGLIAGLLGGLVGVGGGVIIIPLMTETLKFRQHEAHGTSLITVVFTGVAGSVFRVAPSLELKKLEAIFRHKTLRTLLNWL